MGNCEGVSGQPSLISLCLTRRHTYIAGGAITGNLSFLKINLLACSSRGAGGRVCRCVCSWRVGYGCSLPLIPCRRAGARSARRTTALGPATPCALRGWLARPSVSCGTHSFVRSFVALRVRVRVRFGFRGKGIGLGLGLGLGAHLSLPWRPDDRQQRVAGGLARVDGAHPLGVAL